MKKLLKMMFMGIGILVVGIIALALLLPSDESTTTTTGEKPKEEKKAESVTKANYDKIVVGDTLSGEGGMTIAEVEKILGKPDDKMESSSTGMNGEEIKMEDFSWYTGDFESISVSFTDGKVSHKLWLD